MPTSERLYVGPSLRRIRRDRGLTQSDMAADLDVSPSYIALLERNHRPLSAEVLLRLVQTYGIDMSTLADKGSGDAVRLRSVLKDPIFADIELPSLETTDVVTNFPGIAEAFLRLYTAYQEEQMALADRGSETRSGTGRGAEDESDPVAEARRFLAARRNSFPLLDETGERFAQAVKGHESIAGYFLARHKLTVRRVPREVMIGSTRRLDFHRKQILLDEEIDTASQNFQLALQLAYLDMGKEIDAVLHEGHFSTETGERLTRRALASYAAAAVLMPYSAFARAVEARRYDVEALARQFGVSFEQTAHRLTSLQKPGEERVPFFFIRVDEAGNVSKRLDGAGFPFARHGGGCPLWNIHQCFRTPRQIVTQWLELPDGQRFFSIARTVTAGGGGFGRPRVDRAVALACAAEHAGRLIYTEHQPAGGAEDATPIGVTCRLCQRTECIARSAPPIGRQVLPDEIRRTSTPFGFSDT